MSKIQVVILCGGKGTRLRPLTNEIPKVLIEINGKSILERNLDNLTEIASSIVLIIGNHHGSKIYDKIGFTYNNIPVKYVTQEEPMGTGHALMCAKEELEEKFMVFYGDDIYDRTDFEKISESDLGIVGCEVENPSSFGVLETDEGKLINVIEKPEDPKSHLANVGLYVLNKSIFNHKLEKSERGEYELTDYLSYLIDTNQTINVIETDYWIPINDHKQLEMAKEVLV